MESVTLDPSTWRVLLIDDEEDNLIMVSRFLKLRHAQVSMAASGADGLAMLANESFNLVLLDIAMPEMDGIEVLKHIRANPATSPLAVIALTAHAALAHANLTQAFDGYIPKPFDIQTLIDGIQEIFKACLFLGYMNHEWYYA